MKYRNDDAAGIEPKGEPEKVKKVYGSVMDMVGVTKGKGTYLVYILGGHRHEYALYLQEHFHSFVILLSTLHQLPSPP
jgi:hypothetical protein